MTSMSSRPFNRRSFLAGSAATTAAIAAVQWQAWGAVAQVAPAVPGPPFTLGVASGDPDATSVVLWTRLAPAPLDGGGMPPEDVPVTWEVARDPGFGSVVRSGAAPAVAALAHSVHVVADGLEPDTWYFYRFSAGGYESAVGRTRTTPPAGTCAVPLRMAIASCQDWTDGYYTAHAALAEEDTDLVFWLGDYIYEGGVGNGVRPHNSPEVTTLAAYRNRYGLYKGDPDLQASHLMCPWAVVWDDHEVENDYAGDRDQDGSDPALFLPRRAAAYQAWYEHQPVRLPVPSGPDYQIYRTLDWGDLARFFLLDTRQYRADQVCDTGELLADPCPAFEDPSRTITGSAQETWMSNGMRSSAATWNVLAQQVIFTKMPVVGKYNNDQWDGYPVQRDRVRDLLAGGDVSNPIILTGDIHASGVGRVLQNWDDEGSATVATEFVGTSISSTFGDAQLADLGQIAIGAIPWVEYVNTKQRGYVRHDITEEAWTGNYRLVSTALETSATVATDFSWVVPAGAPGDACAEPVSTTPTTTAVAATATPRFTG